MDQAALDQNSSTERDIQYYKDECRRLEEQLREERVKITKLLEEGEAKELVIQSQRIQGKKPSTMERNISIRKNSSRQWKKTWTKIVGKYLYYFNSKQDGSLLGHFNLDDCTLHHTPTVPSSQKFVFELRCGKDVYNINAKSHDSKEAWLSYISSITGKSALPPPAILRMDGNDSSGGSSSDVPKLQRKFSALFKGSPKIVVEDAPTTPPSTKKHHRISRADKSLVKSQPDLMRKSLSEGEVVKTPEIDFLKEMSAVNTSGRKKKNNYPSFLRLFNVNLNAEGFPMDSQISEIWNRHQDHLSIWCDFPRICKNIRCYNKSMEPIVWAQGKIKRNSDEIQRMSETVDTSASLSEFPFKLNMNGELDAAPKDDSQDREVLRTSSQGSFGNSGNIPGNLGVSAEKDLPRTGSANSLEAEESMDLLSLKRKLQDEEPDQEVEARMAQMKENFQIFSYFLNEHSDFLNIDQNFPTHLKLNDTDVQNRLRGYANQFIRPDSKVYGLLKLLNQSVLAPPYIHLRSKFSEIDSPITDVHVWLIEVIFNEEETVVIHSKRAKANSEERKDEFYFVWHLKVTLDKDASRLISARLSITHLEMGSHMDRSKAKKIKAVVDSLQNK